MGLLLYKLWQERNWQYHVFDISKCCNSVEVMCLKTCVSETLAFKYKANYFFEILHILFWMTGWN